ncbi:hypothetical protein UlMin_030582 [Ulmus minor]
MAEQVQKTSLEQLTKAEDVLSQSDKTDEKPLKPEPLMEETEVSDDKIPQSGSFNEESTRVADLSDSEKKALDDLKHRVREALDNHEFTTTVTLPSPPKAEATPVVVAEEEEKTPAPEDQPEKAGEDQPAKAGEDQPAEAGEPKDEAPAQPETSESVVVEEKAAPVADSNDDDGAKTVEAIEETIVAVSSSAAQEEVAPGKETEENKTVAEEEEKKDVKEEALEAQQPPPDEVSIWGIPLLAEERSDVVLLKFLRARDFKVKEAFAMIKNTVRWRKEFGIDELVDEDLGDDLEKVVFMHGVSKEGHPVCYNIYGGFQNKELYKKTFSDEEKRQRFLRWRIQFLERSIRKLDFTPGGICTIVQVNDLKNSPGPGKRELRQATKQALQLLQDNYPEFVAKQVFINVPWWYLAVNKMISPFLTQRTKSKFVFASPAKSAETLLRYISAEQIPIKYGGLSKDGEFGSTDAVTEITVRPAAKHTVEFPVTESCLLTWEVRVVGWDVNYGAEFVPTAEDSYTVIIQKSRKVGSGEEPVVSNSFKIGEPGKVVLTIDNPTSKKKKLLYRLKTKLASSE